MNPQELSTIEGSIPWRDVLGSPTFDELFVGSKGPTSV